MANILEPNFFTMLYWFPIIANAIKKWGAIENSTTPNRPTFTDFPQSIVNALNTNSSITSLYLSVG